MCRLGVSAGQLLKDAGQHLLVVMSVSLQSLSSTSGYRLPVAFISKETAAGRSAFLWRGPEHRFYPIVIKREVLCRAFGAQYGA